MTRVALDAGVLIAADRRDRKVWTYLRGLEEAATEVVVPAGALAQAWRGPASARLAMLLAASIVLPLEERLARRSGELLAASGTADAVDASVVVTAVATGCTVVITSDRADLAHLAGFLADDLRVVALDDLDHA